MPPASSALILTTYNSPHFLKPCLESLLRQSRMPTEVLVADDGSTERTRELVDSYKNHFAERGSELKHIWHEDKGFRRSAIINKALRDCSSEYVIFSDGDCIYHPHFVRDHLGLAQQNTVVSGKRCMISEEESRFLLDQASFRYPRLIHCKKIHYGVRIPCISSLFVFFSKFFKKKQNSLKGVLGCNIALHLKDAQEVNGFEELFEGWGREDNDFIQRLLNKGLSRKDAICSAVLFHLHHNENDKSSFEKNSQLFEQSKTKIQARQGLLQKSV